MVDQRLDEILVGAHILMRVHETMDDFGICVNSVTLYSRLMEDLGLGNLFDSTPYDVLIQNLVEDFGWAWIALADEEQFRTVKDLTSYFAAHYSLDGIVVNTLRAGNSS